MYITTYFSTEIKKKRTQNSENTLDETHVHPLILANKIPVPRP
jgi:hypothetical protein